jgi:hypothetical protein
MAKKHLSKETLSRGEDWLGNNAAVRCPVCSNVFIVSGFVNKGQRQCPSCHWSTAQITNEQLTIDWPDEPAIPRVLTRAELEAGNRLAEFVELVKEGGAVRAASIKGKLPKAEKVAFVERGGRMIAAAAKKLASPSRAQNISENSGYQLHGDVPELGYVAVSGDCRGQGLSTKVVRRILFEFGDTTVFATTSDKKMKSVLAHNGLSWVGHEWDSERAGERLSLWIKEEKG